MDSCLRSEGFFFFYKNKFECEAMVKIEFSSGSREIAGDLKKKRRIILKHAVWENTSSNPLETDPKS